MSFYDFHHHSLGLLGIYNLSPQDPLPSSPFSIGLHPMQIEANYREEIAWIEEKAKDPYCLAIGECGLDYRSTSPFEEKVFEMQIELANSMNKPMIIHCVRRQTELLKFHKNAKTPWIVHGFNRKSAIAEPLTKKGIYLSFGNPLLYNVSLQALFRALPLDQIFLETDSFPVEIEKIYQKAAELKAVSVEELQRKIEQNLKKVIGNE